MSDSLKKAVGIALVVVATIYTFGAASGAAWAMVASWIVPTLAITGNLLLSTIKPGASASFGSTLQLSGDPTAARPLIYGEAWTGGVLRYRDVAGVNNQDLYLLIVLAGHSCDSVPTVTADKNVLTLDGSGNVTAPAQYVGLMNIRYYLGSDTQTADSTLTTVFAGKWTSNHRLRGCTYAIVKMTLDETNLNSPPQFAFKVRGRKVYDARLDSTNGGSGAHRLASEATWAWSENNELCLNDYDRGVIINSKRVAGVGIPTTRFDWSNVIAEANVCDEAVALAVGGTEKRYTANGIIDTRQDHNTVRALFESAFAGDAIYSDAKWRYFAGAYRTPTLSLLPDHFIGALKHTPFRGESGRYDAAQGRYSASAEYGQIVDYAPVRLASATVGGERYTSMDFQLVNDVIAGVGTDGGARAQRVALLQLQKQAAGKRIQCTTNLYGLRAMPGETIQVTHAAFGLTTQTMRVLEVQLRPVQDGDKTGLVVDLTLEAGPSSLYTWSAAETAIAASPALPQLALPPPLSARGPTVNINPAFSDSAGNPSSLNWSMFSGTALTSVVALTDGVAGRNAMRANSALAAYFYSENEPIDRARTYRISVQARQVTSTPVNYLLVAFYDANGALIIGATDPQNWLITGQYHYWARYAQAFGTATFTKYQTTFGANGQYRIPTGAVSCRIGCLANYAGAAAENIDFQDFRLEVIDDTLESWTPVLSGVSRIGKTFTKVDGAASTWDAAFSSQESYPACLIEATVVSTADTTMLALNSDPTTDANYTSLDHALHHDSGGTAYRIYENGSLIATVGGTPAAGDRMSVSYDGQTVQYFVNGTLLWSTPRLGAKLYADSSFYNLGGSLSLVSFAPFGPQRAVLDELRDDFAYLPVTSSTDFYRKWISRESGGDILFLTGVAGTPMGTAIQVGDNSGDDEIWVALAQLMPYDGFSLYEVGCLVEQPNGAGFFYCGVEGVAADGVTLINTAGANTYGSQHYFAASGVSVGPGVKMYRGYFKGYGGSPGAQHSDSSSPGTMYSSSVAYVRPMFIANYNHVAGKTNVIAIWVRRLGGALTAKNTVNSPEIDVNATSLTHASQVTTFTVTQLGHVPIQLDQVNTVTFTPTVTCTLRCTFTGTFRHVANGASVQVQLGVWKTGATPPWVYEIPVTGGAGVVTQGSFAQTVDIACTAGVSTTIAGGFSKFVSGDTLTINANDLSVVEMRR